MQVEKGDVVVLDFTGRVKGGDIFDSTFQDEAKKLGREANPLTAIIGKGKLIPGLEDAILGMEKDEEKDIEIPPERAYGKRDPNLVRIVPLSNFKKAGINPTPGMTVDLDGFPARIVSVSGGRVQIDLNHPLAGKTLEFHVKIRDIIKDENEKVKAISKKYFAGGLETKVNSDIEITATKAMLEKGYTEKKAYLIRELLALGKPVRWIEVYKEK